MTREFFLYNTISREKEKFVSETPGMAGIYVCGPTVYGDAHLGHARPAITYDVLVRYLKHIGYKVRYVRNITDVGHLENDADQGEDKISKKARLEQLEPMEVVQHYTIKYHDAMRRLNTLPPNIEPRASGHIIEQISLIEKIIEKGYAYISNGSVYFDVVKYNKDYQYGELSGRSIDDMLASTRSLDGQDDKKNSFDFALWKRASAEHIMRWPSPWSDGFPGWHTECSAMSTKYLGEKFDIHGGGMDLLFPHHECEIAQNRAARGETGVRYWMHNNMITVKGQKMGKSLGNFITLDDMFEGKGSVIEQPYSPMTIRFFILQAHYRSTLDFSNEALKAAEKGLKRVLLALKDVKSLPTDNVDDNTDLARSEEEVYNALSDDLNTPIALAHIFDVVKLVNSVKDRHIKINDRDKKRAESLLTSIVTDVLGLIDEGASDSHGVVNGIMEMVLDIRQSAKKNKDFETSDKIRDRLNELGIKVKDTKEGAEWELP